MERQIKEIQSMPAEERSRHAADRYIQSLLKERAGYERDGNDQGVKDVEVELTRVGYGDKCYCICANCEVW